MIQFLRPRNDAEKVVLKNLLKNKGLVIIHIENDISILLTWFYFTCFTCIILMASLWMT